MLLKLILCSSTIKKQKIQLNELTTLKNKEKHYIYSQVHHRTLNNVSATCSNIRSENNVLFNLTSKKVALVKIERKRYWLDADDSVASDHPSIEATATMAANDKTNVEKQSPKRKHEEGREYPFMLTYTRIKNVQNFR